MVRKHLLLALAATVMVGTAGSVRAQDTTTVDSDQEDGDEGRWGLLGLLGLAGLAGLKRRDTDTTRRS